MSGLNDKIVETEEEGEIMEEQTDLDLEIDIDEDEENSWFGLGRK